MSNTAEQFESNPVEVDGLEDLYDDKVTTNAVEVPTEGDIDTIVADIETALADKVEVVDDNNETTCADIIEWLPTTQAAARLEKSERTIQRYAKSGKLESKTDDFGRLLIGFTTFADHVATEADRVPTGNDSKPTAADSLKNNADTLYEKVIDDYRDQISSLQDKLERTTFQLGRMQSDLEHKDKEIKLLTDRKLEFTKWQRFVRWFKGG